MLGSCFCVRGQGCPESKVPFETATLGNGESVGCILHHLRQQVELNWCINPLKTGKGESTFIFGAFRFAREHFFLEGPQASSVYPSGKSRMQMMSMEHWWNNVDKRRWTYWERNLSQCHFVHHRSHLPFFFLPRMSSQNNFSYHDELVHRKHLQT